MQISSDIAAYVVSNVCVGTERCHEFIAVLYLTIYVAYEYRDIYSLIDFSNIT